MTRQAAVTATLSLDSYAALKRAVLAPRQTYHPAVGDMVFWWRAPGRFSKVLAHEEGWQGPGLVMRVLPTKVVIDWSGGVVECAPHQCRRWSRDEAGMLLQYKSLLKLGNQTFQSKRQVGVRDYTGDPPPSHEEYNTAPPGYHGPTIFAPASPPAPPPKLPLQTVSPVPIVTSALSAPASVAPTTAPMEASSPKPAPAKKRDLSRTPPKRASAAVQPAETEQLREGAPRGPAEATAVPDSNEETEEVSLRQERKPKAPKRKSRARAKPVPRRGEPSPRRRPTSRAPRRTSRTSRGRMCQAETKHR